jgi:hypothetical protein
MHEDIGPLKEDTVFSSHDRVWRSIGHQDPLDLDN